MSFGLLGSACVAMLPGSAHATTSEVTSFAQTAMVTHWSLPQAAPAVGPLPEPTFVVALDAPALTPSEETSVPKTLVGIAATVHLPKRPEAAHVAGVAGPALAADDLEARGFTTYERERPYRTPADIKRLEIAFQLLNAADAVSTVVCLKREDCQENNPIYGKHPRPIVVVGAKAVAGAVHYWAMRSLLPDHPGLARAFGWFSVTVQGSVVGLNMSQLF
jgi:hypothetical protein